MWRRSLQWANRMLSELSIRILREIESLHDPFKSSYYEYSSEKRTQLLSAIKRERTNLLDETFHPFIRVWESSPALRRVQQSLRAYVDRCDWCFLDLIALA